MVSDPALAAALVQSLLERQADTEERVSSMLFCNVESRLAAFLVRAAARWGIPDPRGTLIEPDGTIYVAALTQDGIVRLDGDSLTYIAGLFRGSSDVDYSPTANALFVTNFDSGALVVPGLSPRLPFTIDVVRLATAAK